jgi:hypothetical protein
MFYYKIKGSELKLGRIILLTSTSFKYKLLFFLDKYKIKHTTMSQILEMAITTMSHYRNQIRWGIDFLGNEQMGSLIDYKRVKKDMNCSMKDLLTEFFNLILENPITNQD